MTTIHSFHMLLVFFFFFFYRTSVQSSTGFTLFFLLHFCKAKLPIHIKMERAIREGPKELPTESKMLESTGLSSTSKMNTAPKQHTTLPVPKKDRNSSTTRSTIQTPLSRLETVLKENTRPKHRMLVHLSGVQRAVVHEY